ncbi:MAG: hypothetical protein JWO13_486 [Acidobacteriales bacterium]|nr:hypothetical protein [Terriglobales bacterium]
MFIRNLSIQLKPNSVNKFTTHFATEIIPVLRKQKGFQNALILGAPGKDSVTALSFWDTNENADLYAAAVYPEMLTKMSQFLESTPVVHPAEFLYSTFSQAAAVAATGNPEAKIFAA